MHISRFPRLHFAHLPTPLEPLKNLSKLLGGPQFFVKRDDCTGLATGGNKTRKLEFLLGEALQKNADTIITQGATQSNHVRQTAAICSKLDLRCEILLEHRTAAKIRTILKTGMFCWIDFLVQIYFLFLPELIWMLPWKKRLLK